MGISKILFDSLSSKLKLESLRIKEDFTFAKNLSKTVLNLSESKKAGNEKNIAFFEKTSSSKKSKESFLVTYIITVSFTKTNTIIHISDSKGNPIGFFTAGNVDLSGKQKTKRGLAVLRLMSIMSKNFNNLIGKSPVALHLNSVTSHKNLIVKKLKEKFFIKVIKSFNRTPYNGCRKKKLRRKKKLKKLFK